MAPLADTVGFVYGQKRDGKPGQDLSKGWQVKPLRRHQEKLDPSPLGLPQHASALPSGESSIQNFGLQPGFPGPPHLVFHEGDEGAHHKNHPREEKGGQLKADALPSPSGENAQSVPTLHGGPDQGLLSGTEPRVPQVASQSRHQPWNWARSRWMDL